MNCVASLFFSLSVAAMGSSPVTMLWQRVSFENEAGAKTTIQTRGELLSKLEVTLHGRRIVVPPQFITDVRLPILSEADLVYSSGINGGRSDTTISLQIPVLLEDHEVSARVERRRYQYIFRNDRFVERMLEVRVAELWTVEEVRKVEEK